MNRILTCKICNKSMNCKQITKWQYVKNEDGRYRKTKRRFIFPTHKKGLLFKKICDGSKFKVVFEESELLYTQKETPITEADYGGEDNTHD